MISYTALQQFKPSSVEWDRYSADLHFEFMGFDLVEELTRIGALTECGWFSKAFSIKELSDCGLIADYSRAKEIQESLVEHYPDEDHAYCTIIAIWKMKER
jgi:hypothetical protein